MENSCLQKVMEAEKLFAGYEITGSELARVRKLRQKIESGHVTVSVIGQFKRGKSALVNRILGENMLPVGIVPVTAVVTMIDYGEESAAIHFNNGMVKKVEIDRLARYVNEQENCDNRLGVAKVALTCPSDFLKQNLTFVDTPGVGSVHEKNSKEAYGFVKESDAVIFTLSVDSPINQIEIEFLRNAREYAAKFYFAVNKTDLIGDADLKAYLDYCGKFLAELMESESVVIFPVSAKTGEGVEALKSAVLKDLDRESGKILAYSAELKLQDITRSALRNIALYRGALSFTGAEFDKKLEQLREYFRGLHDEAAALPQALKANPMVCEAHINDVKNRLSERVRELFKIDYHYEVEEVKDEEAMRREPAHSGLAQTQDITARVDALCSSLDKTLNTVFMHREENTYVVARRINDLNRLVRKLVKMRDMK